MPAITTTLKSLRSGLVDRRTNDRGAVLVEAAICIPLLLLVILGAVEAGLAWEAKSSSVSGVRSGVIRAATGAGDSDTDLRILQSVVGEVGADNVDRIDWVMVFDASGDAAQRFESCAESQGGPGCIVYQQAFLQDVAAATNVDALQTTFFDNGGGAVVDGDGNVTGYTCDTSGQLDSAWCAGQRTATGDAQVGIAISYGHEWLSGIFPFDAPSFQEFVVTSTFADGGTDVNGGALAFAATTELGRFDGSDGFGNDAVSFDSTKVETAPNGEVFLGRFAKNESVTATVADQVAGSEVCVSFTLHVVGSWDRERFTVDVGGVTYSESYRYSDLRAAGGSANELGYNRRDHGKFTMNQNSTFPITVCNPNVIPNANGDVEINFSSTLNQNVADESWAIDDIVITTTAPTA